MLSLPASNLFFFTQSNPASAPGGATAAPPSPVGTPSAALPESFAASLLSSMETAQLSAGSPASTAAAPDVEITPGQQGISIDGGGVSIPFSSGATETPPSRVVHGFSDATASQTVDLATAFISAQQKLVPPENFEVAAVSADDAVPEELRVDVVRIDEEEVPFVGFVLVAPPLQSPLTTETGTAPLEGEVGSPPASFDRDGIHADLQTGRRGARGENFGAFETSTPASPFPAPRVVQPRGMNDAVDLLVGKVQSLASWMNPTHTSTGVAGATLKSQSIPAGVASDVDVPAVGRVDTIPAAPSPPQTPLLSPESSQRMEAAAPEFTEHAGMTALPPVLSEHAEGAALDAPPLVSESLHAGTPSPIQTIETKSIPLSTLSMTAPAPAAVEATADSVVMKSPVLDVQRDTTATLSERKPELASPLLAAESPMQMDGSIRATEAPAAVPEGEQRVIDQIVTETLSRAKVDSSPNGREITVRLDPPELGEITIHARRNPAGEVIVQVTASHPQTQALFDRHHDDIARTFADQGVSLSESSLPQSDTGTSSSFKNREAEEFQQGHQRREQHGRQPSAPHFRTTSSNASEVNFTA